MFFYLKKRYVIILKKIEIGSAIGVRLTKYTGKSKEFIHPKHFLENKPWFVNFLTNKDLILDLGSGNGQNAIKAAKVAKKVIGIEKNFDLIKIAQRTAERKKINNIDFIYGNLEKNLPFSNQKFDKIIFLDVLEHLKNRKQILLEIKRILKPGGLLVIGVPNKDTTWKKLQKEVGIFYYSDPDHKVEFSEKTIKSLLIKSNFKIIHFEYGKFDTPFRGLYDIVGGLSLTLYRLINTWRQTKSQKYPEDASGFEIVAQK